MWPTSRRRAASRATRASRSATSESRLQRRAIGWLAGLWTGVLLGIALIAAPAAFGSAPRELAGAIVGRMFAQEAHLSLALGVVLLVLVRAKARGDAAAGAGSLFST